MLVEFAVRNFKSIKDEVRLSMVAGSGKEHIDNLIEPEGNNKFKLLKSAVIYGANASGKSNLLRAFMTTTQFVTLSVKHGKPFPIFPFLFNDETRNQPTSFEVVFIASDNIRYQYGFSATKERIYDEWLYAYPHNRQQKLFERIYEGEPKDGIENVQFFGDNLKGEKEIWKKSTKADSLFLSTAISLNSQSLKPVFEFFDRQCGGDVKEVTYDNSINWCRNKTKKEKILNFLKKADFSINDIMIVHQGYSISGGGILPKDFDEFQILIIHKDNKNELVKLDLKEESDGTQKMFALASHVLDVLDNGGVFVVDELNDSLHPLLVRHLINLFHNPETNPKWAQLIFSTHDTSVMDKDLFRRDQIWFCERKDDQSTDLYSLADYSPRKDENFAKAYLGGRYGALPFIDEINLRFKECYDEKKLK